MGACEFPFINSVHDMIAALNKPDFGSFPRAMNSPACGQCIRVTGPNGTVDVQIVDMVKERRHQICVGQTQRESKTLTNFLYFIFVSTQ
jgi:hypothetical protein